MPVSQSIKGFPLVNQLLCPCSMLIIHTTQLTVAAAPSIIPQNLQDQLHEFDGIFGALIGLPPPRPQNHGIPLQDENVVVKIRPYRYPTVQKNEIEKIILEMFHTRVIRDNTNSFASLIVTVTKKHGS